MDRSKQIAGLAGPVLMVLAATEAMNLDIWAVSLPAVVYLNGMILFGVGLAVVRVHNLWVRDWRVLITLAGWAVMAGGLYRMAAPRAPQAPEGPATYAFLAVMGMIGVFLTAKACRPRRR
jgi:hypothetical protein